MIDFAGAVHSIANSIADVGLGRVVLAVVVLIMGLPLVMVATTFAAKKAGKLAEVPLVKARDGVCRWIGDRIIVATAIIRHRGHATVEMIEEALAQLDDHAQRDNASGIDLIVQALIFAKSSGKTSIERSRIVRAEATCTVVVSGRATGRVYTEDVVVEGHVTVELAHGLALGSSDSDSVLVQPDDLEVVRAPDRSATAPPRPDSG